MKFFNGTALPAIVLLGTTLLVSACQAAPGTSSDDAVSASSPPSAAATQALPLITVHKSPDCGCCSVWVEHVRAAG